MSIWEAFGMGRYKGFSREAGLLLDEAVELAGGFGCKKADTGHLLLAMLQTDRGAAGRFLAGKNITELAVRRQLHVPLHPVAHREKVFLPRFAHPHIDLRWVRLRCGTDGVIQQICQHGDHIHPA